VRRSAPETRSQCDSADEIVYRFSDGAALLSLGESEIFFSAAEQQLFELDSGAAFFARHVQRGTTLEAIVEDLASSGSSVEEASEWAMNVLADWSRRGLIRADVAPETCRSGHQTIEAGGVRFDIGYADEDLRDLISPIFRHLECPAAGPCGTCRVAEAGDGMVVVSPDFAPAAVVSRNQSGPALKALLFQQVIEAADCLAALHVGCLVREAGLLLVGPPGAGKSTLALGLMAAGFGYAADDVSLLLPGGRVRGVPFAPTAKQGSWPILERAGYDLRDLRVFERLDQQRVRFIPPPAGICNVEVPVRWIVRVRRDDQPPGLRPLSPREALSALMSEGFAPSGKASVDCMHAITNLVGSAECRDLHYADLSDAVRLLRELTGHG
jgi:hypothetical protein